jgi:hypothetical protein
LKPLLGDWEAGAKGPSGAPMQCTRSFRPLGKGWVELEAQWDVSADQPYREIALFGAMPDGALGFFSFTSDGKRSEGRQADGSDVHPDALAFEAQMPAGLARAIYWPDESGDGFHFAVENKTKKGWNRFLSHHYRAEGVKGGTAAY